MTDLEKKLSKLIIENTKGYEVARDNGNIAVSNFLRGRLEIYVEWLTSLNKQSNGTI